MRILIFPSKIWAKNAYYTWQNTVTKPLNQHIYREPLIYYGKYREKIDCSKVSEIFVFDNVKLITCYIYFLKILFIFRERRRDREREGENHRCGRETSIGCLSYMPRLGSWPATQACSLTGNWMGGLPFAERLPNNWATSVRSNVAYFSCKIKANYVFHSM